MPWEIYVVTVMLASVVLAAETVYAMADHRGARGWGTLTVLGVVAFPVAVIVHNVISVAINGEEAVSFILGVFVAPAAITAGAVGSAVALRTGAPLAALGFAFAAAGLLLLPAYAGVAFVASWLGEPLRSTGGVDQVLLPLSLLAITAGVITAAFALAADGRRPAIA